MTALTDRLDEWAALAEKATEGPWEAYRRHSAASVTGDVVGVCQESAGDVDDDVLEDAGLLTADAAFIAASRTALPAAIEALQAVLALHRENGPDDDTCQGYTRSVPGGYGYLDHWCVECSDQSAREYGVAWPCLTAKRIASALGVTP